MLTVENENVLKPTCLHVIFEGIILERKGVLNAAIKCLR